jgi:hypothetical protein
MAIRTNRHQARIIEVAREDSHREAFRHAQPLAGFVRRRQRDAVLLAYRQKDRRSSRARIGMQCPNGCPDHDRCRECRAACWVAV